MTKTPHPLENMYYNHVSGINISYIIHAELFFPLLISFLAYLITFHINLMTVLMIVSRQMFAQIEHKTL
jgi:hypothetical protein